MALSAHEMILVLRARDEASRILRSFSGALADVDKEAQAAAQRQFARGAALATSGVAVAGTALGIMQAFNEATKSTIAYKEAVALTETQVDGAGVSFQGLYDMGIRLGRDMPVQFDQIQSSMYDIFSSIETDGKGAELVLQGIGQAAIGGKVDMETAGRGIVQIMNAWKLEAGDVSRINDVMFQLVRKGVGTYDEFSKSLGKAIPSALKAGQSVESLSGMMAFLTRNGLNTNMAATSAARALDAMSRPQTIARFKEMGIAVTDTAGNFRPMSDIAGELRDKLAHMTPEDAAAKLTSLFKGSGGTIQAMRFFNLAVQDSQGLLQDLTDYMHDAGGAAQEAYDIMANTPEAKLQAMQNEWEVLKISIGEGVLGAKMALVDGIKALMSAFNNLSPGMKDLIVKGAMIVTAIMLIVGVVMMVVGTFLMFSAAAAMAGIAMGTIAAIVGGVVVAIAALIAIGVLIYKNWDTIKEKGKAAWDAIVNAVKQVGKGLSDFGNNVKSFAQEIWGYLGPIVKDLWDMLVEGVQSIWVKIQPPLSQIGEAFSHLFSNLGNVATRFGSVLGLVFDLLKPVFYAFVGVIGIVINTVKGGLGPAFELIGNIFRALLTIISGAVNFLVGLFTGDWDRMWKGIGDVVAATVTGIVDIITGLVMVVWGLIKGFVTGIIDFFIHLWDVLVGHSIIPDMVNAIIEWFGTLGTKVLDLVKELIGKVVAFFIDLAIRVIAKAVEIVTNVVKFFAELPGKVINAVVSLATKLLAEGQKWLSNLRNAVNTGISNVLSLFIALPGRVIGAILKLGGQMASQGRTWFNQLRSAVNTGISNVITIIRNIPTRIRSILSGFSLRSIGYNIANSLASGISSAVGNVVNRARNLASSALNAAKNVFGIGSPSKVFTYFGQMSGLGLANGLVDLINKVRGAGQKLADAALAPIQAFDPPVVFGGPNPGDPGFGFGGDGPEYPPSGALVEMTVNTQEIDPIKHAADLGYEVARRLGD